MKVNNELKGISKKNCLLTANENEDGSKIKSSKFRFDSVKTGFTVSYVSFIQVQVFIFMFLFNRKKKITLDIYVLAPFLCITHIARMGFFSIG